MKTYTAKVRDRYMTRRGGLLVFVIGLPMLAILAAIGYATIVRDDYSGIITLGIIVIVGLWIWTAALLIDDGLSD